MKVNECLEQHHHKAQRRATCSLLFTKRKDMYARSTPAVVTANLSTHMHAIRLHFYADFGRAHSQVCFKNKSRSTYLADVFLAATLAQILYSEAASSLILAKDDS